MTVWMVRAGKHGEFEQKFLQDNKIYVTWDGLAVDIGKMTDRHQLFQAMTATYPDAKIKAIHNNVSQVWPFAHGMEFGDLVILPSKMQPSIYVGEITGNYEFDPKAADPCFHSRSIKWIGEAIPRSNFGQDLLYSFGAFMTICRIQRNNAVARIEAMRANGWKPENLSSVISAKHTPEALMSQKGILDDAAVGDTEAENTDIEAVASDQIARLIQAKFAGHSLTRLVDAILRAQGYTTYVSPEGADGGVDILAGSGPLGFGTPRLCVEVKSEAGPIDRPSVDKLLGAMTKFGAQEGLFVSRSGFRKNVQKELASTFFKVRLWTQAELFEALFANYDNLDAEIRAELPLKRIWTLALQGEES
jgi:restriction system protein